MISARRFIPLFLLLLAAAFAATIAAQGSRPCTIAGRVLDSASRAPLAGVSVEAVSDVNGDEPHTIATDQDGAFRLTDLPSGTYTVTLRLPEFQTFKREGLYLAPGMNSMMTVNLKPSR